MLSLLISISALYSSVNEAGKDTLKKERFSIHYQSTVITQYKPAFHASYSGPHSLSPNEETQTSLTSTLFMGANLWKGAQLHIDGELAGGAGLSGAEGVAASTNGETYRVGDPKPVISMARLYFTQRFMLSHGKAKEYHLTKKSFIESYNYFVVTAGKVSLADFFDNNIYSHDPRTQFMSWALMSNGAWDYPANTRGYTPAIVLELTKGLYTIKYSLALLPKTANGSDMDWNVQKASGQVLEVSRLFLIAKKMTSIRLLGFYNTGNMGNYNQSVLENSSMPVIADTRSYGRTKYGFGINATYVLSKASGIFFRAGWNDGKNETWVFTEIDRTISAGYVLKGRKWKREDDETGLAFVVSGLSAEHRNYLEHGGLGFMLGDGKLNYTHEHEIEYYYRLSVIKEHLYASVAYQLVIDPGYNKDRGPVNVFSARIHVEL